MLSFISICTGTYPMHVQACAQASIYQRTTTTDMYAFTHAHARTHTRTYDLRALTCVYTFPALLDAFTAPSNMGVQHRDAHQEGEGESD